MLKVVLLVVLVVLAVVAGCFVFRARGNVSSADAHRLVEGGARLLDVRSPEEFASGHVAGAVNIPVGELPGRLAEVGPKETPVVLYCRSGMRAARAQDILKDVGWRSVHNLGGMGNW